MHIQFVQCTCTVCVDYSLINNLNGEVLVVYIVSLCSANVMKSFFRYLVNRK